MKHLHELVNEDEQKQRAIINFLSVEAIKVDMGIDEFYQMVSDCALHQLEQIKPENQ